MPKKSSKGPWGGRNGRPNQSEDKHYFAHDDRTVRMDGSRPRVSFKTQIRPGRDRARNIEMALKNHLDDDISMSAGGNNNGRHGMNMRGRGRGMPRGRNSPVPQRGGRGGQSSRSRQMPLGEANWYKVTIPQGHKFEKDFVVKSLLSYMAPDTFVPIMYKIQGSEASFFVDDHKAADKLLSCDSKITTSTGFKLFVRVKPGFPPCEVDGNMKERMKLAMAKRYLQETNALDLSRFHLDPDLVSDYFCTLYRPVILMTVMDIVAEHIPNLEALNLDANKLALIERLNILNKKFPKLKILYIGDNRIRDMSQLDVIKDLKLEELKLAGNPVCNKYKDRHNDYVSDLRSRFPKLLKLDGVELPPPILFDVADEGVKLPPTQTTFIVNEKAQEIAGQFLQQYFLIFDSDNRQPLLDAYHEQACFSMTVSYACNASKLNNYLSESRNLYRLNDSDRRRKLLKQGRLPVVSFISEMPKTKHDLNSFTMDLSLVTEGMMLITVTGMFKELDNKQQPIRYFNRTFIIVPEGGGYCIRNEQLHISNPTEKQEKQAFVAKQPELQAPAPSASGTAVPPVTEETKQQMTIALSQQTNMNLEWSLKCLAEVQWNFDSALSAFREFYALGQIPPEAFAK